MKHVISFELFEAHEGVDGGGKYIVHKEEEKPKPIDIVLVRRTQEYKDLIDAGWQEISGETSQGKPKLKVVGEQEFSKDRMGNIGFFHKKLEKKNGYPYYTIRDIGTIGVALRTGKSVKLDGYKSKEPMGTLNMYKEGMRFLLKYNHELFEGVSDMITRDFPTKGQISELYWFKEINNIFGIEDVSTEKIIKNGNRKMLIDSKPRFSTGEVRIYPEKNNIILDHDKITIDSSYNRDQIEFWDDFLYIA